MIHTWFFFLDTSLFHVELSNVFQMFPNNWHDSFNSTRMVCFIYLFKISYFYFTRFVYSTCDSLHTIHLLHMRFFAHDSFISTWFFTWFFVHNSLIPQVILCTWFSYFHMRFFTWFIHFQMILCTRFINSTCDSLHDSFIPYVMLCTIHLFPRVILHTWFIYSICDALHTFISTFGFLTWFYFYMVIFHTITNTVCYMYFLIIWLTCWNVSSHSFHVITYYHVEKKKTRKIMWHRLYT